MTPEPSPICFRFEGGPPCPLKKSSKGVPLKKSSPTPGPIVTVRSDRMETTEGFTLFATSTKPFLQSFAVVFWAAFRLHAGNTRIRIIRDSKKIFLRELSLFLILYTSILYISLRHPPGDGSSLYKNHQESKKNKWVKRCILLRKSPYFGTGFMRIPC